MISATFHPAKPTVGDLISIDFPRPVTLDASPSFEVVSHAGKRFVIRTFEPKPIALSGVAGDTRFRNLVVPVRSVLGVKDAQTPSPLKPPHALPSASLPLILIAAALLAAIAAWTAVWFRARKRRVVPQPILTPAEQFRMSVEQARSSKQRWASFADAARVYLAQRGYGSELTTAQLLPLLPHQRELIAEILRLGDYEKFSPFGAPQGDFDALLSRAPAILDAYEPRIVEEERAA
ncbi:MAG TPA: hypothetical protein VGJ82_03140 [Thermoanaerobaculia bacterium]|jgi:hypothetical protein